MVRTPAERHKPDTWQRRGKDFARRSSYAATATAAAARGKHGCAAARTRQRHRLVANRLPAGWRCCRHSSETEDEGEERVRPALVAAALTVLRAFVVAGRPGASDLEPYARFEDWSNLVRAALVWLGEPDPVETRKAIENIDPERENLDALTRAWLIRIGINEWVSARDLLAACNDKGGDESEEAYQAMTSLDDAIRTLFAGKSPIPATLGKYLVQYSGRIVDGLSIQRRSFASQSTMFRLVRAGGNRG